MDNLFIQVFNLSISASYLVLAVLLLRPFLKKAPKWISVALWGLVGLRLVFPFSIESMLSLLPSAEVIPADIALSPAPSIQSGLPVIDSTVNTVIQNQLTVPAPVPTPTPSANPLQTWLLVISIIWAAGISFMLVYTAISYLRLQRQVLTAVRVDGNIYRSEAISSPFVLGLFRPRIYLPTALTEADMPHAIAHEQAHIARRDHWIKPIGFVLLSLHWFNPLMLAAYIFLCRDIEMACDEKVIKALGTELRIDYSQALLSCSISRKSIAACPLAFGEVSIKRRIKSVLNYKRPAFWVTAVSLVLCLCLAVFFLTVPVEAEKGSEATLSGASDTRPTSQPEADTSIPNSTAPLVPEPIAPLVPDYVPSPAVPVGTEIEITYAHSNTLTEIKNFTYEEAVAYFGEAGVPLNSTPAWYYWQMDGSNVLLYFGTNCSFDNSETLGSIYHSYVRKPADTEQVRQDFLDITAADIDSITLTGINSQGNVATVTLPQAQAAQILAVFQDNVRDAEFAGLDSFPFMPNPSIYLTVYTRDGSHTTVDFSSLLRIGEYFFAPTSAKQQSFYNGLYQQLVQALEG